MNMIDQLQAKSDSGKSELQKIIKDIAVYLGSPTSYGLYLMDAIRRGNDEVNKKRQERYLNKAQDNINSVPGHLEYAEPSDIKEVAKYLSGAMNSTSVRRKIYANPNFFENSSTDCLKDYIIEELEAQLKEVKEKSKKAINMNYMTQLSDKLNGNRLIYYLPEEEKQAVLSVLIDGGVAHDLAENVLPLIDDMYGGFRLNMLSTLNSIDIESDKKTILKDRLRRYLDKLEIADTILVVKEKLDGQGVDIQKTANCSLLNIFEDIVELNRDIIKIMDSIDGVHIYGTPKNPQLLYDEIPPDSMNIILESPKGWIRMIIDNNAKESFILPYDPAKEEMMAIQKKLEKELVEEYSILLKTTNIIFEPDEMAKCEIPQFTAQRNQPSHDFELVSKASSEER